MTAHILPCLTCLLTSLTSTLQAAAAVCGTRSIDRFYPLVALVPFFPVCPLLPAFVYRAPPAERMHQAIQNASGNTKITTALFFRNGSQRCRLYRTQWESKAATRTSSLGQLSAQTEPCALCYATHPNTPRMHNRSDCYHHTAALCWWWCCCTSIVCSLRTEHRGRNRYLTHIQAVCASFRLLRSPVPWARRPTRTPLTHAYRSLADGHWGRFRGVCWQCATNANINTGTYDERPCVRTKSNRSRMSVRASLANGALTIDQTNRGF